MTRLVLALGGAFGAFDVADLIAVVPNALELLPAVDLGGVLVGLLGSWGLLTGIRVVAVIPRYPCFIGARAEPNNWSKLEFASLLSHLPELTDLPRRRGPPSGSGSMPVYRRGHRSRHHRRSS